MFLDDRQLLRLVRLVNAGLVIVLAFAFAELTWMVVGFVTTSDDAEVMSPVVPNASKRQAQLDVSRIINAHLFGVFGDKVPAVPITAPETKLDLVLRGIAHSNIEADARAIIARPGRHDAHYRVGATLPGGAILYTILADRVILQRNGRFETLRLIKVPSTGLKVEIVDEAGESIDYRANKTMSKSLGRYRQQLLTNPGSLAGILRVEPVTQGKRFIGYRLASGREKRFLSQFGLNQGDVLTAVNGITINAPTRAIEVIQNLTRANEIHLQILRGYQRMRMSYRINQ